MSKSSKRPFQNDLTLWHRRLGHLGGESTKLLTQQAQDGPKGLSSKDMEFCENCVLGKHTQKIHKTSGTPANRIFDKIHADVIGPISPASLGGARYALHVVDEFTHFGKLYTMERKSQAVNYLVTYLNQAKAEHPNCPIRVFRSDNGGEFSGNEFQKILLDRGIKWEPTVPYTPHQNGLVERKGRTLAGQLRAILAESGCPQSFWAELITTVNYLRNLSPSKSVPGNKTPYEAFYNRPPKISHLRVLGCAAYANTAKQGAKKLDARASKCVLVNYHGNSIYRLYNLASKRIITESSIIFNEHDLPFQISKDLKTVDLDEFIRIDDNGFKTNDGFKTEKNSPKFETSPNQARNSTQTRPN